MLERHRELASLQRMLKRYRAVGIVGARQVGKTTLARSLAAKTRMAVSYFDLENPEDVARLSDPMLALKGVKGLVIIDEIQRQPDLFPVLRVLIDHPRSATRFLVLGSASPHLLRQSSETLAGRSDAHLDRSEHTPRSGRTSEGWCIVGRIRPRAGHSSVTCPVRGVFLLGHPWRGRIGSFGRAWSAAVGI